MRRARPTLPDVVGPIVLVLAGVLLVALAAVAAAAEDTVGAQLVYVNLGVGGVVLAGTGGAVHLLTLRRAVRRRRLELARHRRLAAGGEQPR